MANLLFICSKNQWRSPTAELLFKHHANHVARSAGTSAKARVTVNEKMLNWADVILVMEQKHKQLLRERFEAAIRSKKIIVLNIEDTYRFGDPELINLLQKGLTDFL